MTPFNKGATGAGVGQHDPVGFGGQFGYYTDTETGLLCLTHRYYDPGTGKFLNRDPIGYAGGANLYGFCGGNPVNRSDPNGTQQYPNQVLPPLYDTNSADPIYNGTAEEHQEQPSTVAVLSGRTYTPEESLPAKAPINAKLAGGVHPKTGVPFSKTGYPVFVSLFKAILPTRLNGPLISDGIQFRSSTAALAEALRVHPALSTRFNPRQLIDIQSGNGRITDLTWHHNEDGVTMELVNRAIHAQTGHSGGRANTGGRPRSRRTR